MSSGAPVSRFGKSAGMMKSMSTSHWPMVEDYASSMPSDVLAGGENRCTTKGRPLTEAEPSSALVSVITVVFNNAESLQRAMDSVFAQSYPNIEYIVVDGGSTDGTVDIIRANQERLSYWHSRKDKGISDAFNAGVALTRGKYVALVNSDDWMEPDQIANAVKAIEESAAPFVFGDLIYHHPDGQIAYRITGEAEYQKRIWHRMPQLNHPTTLVRRDIYERYGLFRLHWKIGMDYDWLLRLHHAGIKGQYFSAIVGHMSLLGVSDAHWRKCLDEHRLIASQHGGKALLHRCLYFIRVLKMTVRRQLDACLPKASVMTLRKLVNSSLQGPDGR